jgi:hypothetical protein
MSHRSGKKKFIRSVAEDCVLHMKPEDEPDQLSSDIMTYIFSLLLPGEYIYGDRFIEWLFDDRKFIAMRKAYREKYLCHQCFCLIEKRLMKKNIK